MPFDEVVKTGYLHISFDAKIPSENVELGVGVCTDKENDYPTDTYAGTSTHGAVEYFAATSGFNDGVFQEMPMDLTWHKYDIVVDCTGSRPITTTYIDGEDSHTIAGEYYTGIKSLLLFPRGASPDAIPLLDNIYVNHYFADEVVDEDTKLDAPKMYVDYEAGSTKLYVSFSEVIDAEAMDSLDFKLIDAAGNDTGVFEEALIENTNTGVVLEMEEPLESGAYTVEYTGEFYEIVSTLTDMLPASAELFVSGTNDKESRRYYLNEDFEGYAGGMPGNWTELTQALGEGAFANMTATTAENGSTGFTPTSGNFLYEFKNPLTSGVYTIEFEADIDCTNANDASRWDLRLIPEAALECNSSEWSLISFREGVGPQNLDEMLKNYGNVVA